MFPLRETDRARGRPAAVRYGRRRMKTKRKEIEKRERHADKRGKERPSSVCVCVVCSSVDGFPGISFHSNPDRTPRRDSNLQLRQGKKEGMRRMLAAKPTRKENKKGQWCPIAYRQFFRSNLISFLSWLVEIDGRDVGEISGLVIIYAVVVVVLRLSLLVPFVFHSSIALESQGRHIKDSRWTKKKKQKHWCLAVGLNRHSASLQSRTWRHRWRTWCTTRDIIFFLFFFCKFSRKFLPPTPASTITSDVVSLSGTQKVISFPRSSSRRN